MARGRDRANWVSVVVLGVLFGGSGDETCRGCPPRAGMTFVAGAVRCSDKQQVTQGADHSSAYKI